MSYEVMMSREIIFGKVQKALQEALSLEPNKISAEASLRGDLGAESIDMLDIVFRLEKSFDIKIPRGEMFPDEQLFKDPAYLEGDKLTPEGLEELRKRMPYAKVDNIVDDPSLENVLNLITVDMLVRYIEDKLTPA